MTEFDPYSAWLDIPPFEQPPSHYRLLNISPKERNVSVIEEAAHNRINLLEQFATGPHAQDARKLLEEVTQASLCLLDPNRRKIYDAALIAHFRTGFDSAPTIVIPAPRPAQVSRKPDKPPVRRKPPQKSRRVYAAASIAGIVLITLVVVVLINRKSGKESEDEPVSDEITPPAVPSAPAISSTDQPDPIPDVIETDPGGEAEEEVTVVDTEDDIVVRPGNRALASAPPVDAISLVRTPEILQKPSPSLLVVPADATEVGESQSAWAEYLGWGVEHVNAVEMPLVLIPPGEFQMGMSSESDRTAQIQNVSLSRPFYIGRHEVTQLEWRSVMGDDEYPSFYCRQGEGASAVQGMGTNGFPVESITWFQAIEFCNALSRLEMLDEYYRFEPIDESTATTGVVVAGGNGYRLPTEAEWEYACRAGTLTAFHFGEPDLATAESFNSSLAEVLRTTDVEEYAPNPLGLHDMHGNVGEWCHDWFDDFPAESQTPAVDPAGPVASSFSGRVIRGGGYISAPDRCTSMSRAYAEPGAPRRDIGFRVVRSLDPISRREPSEDQLGAELVDLPPEAELLDDVHPELHADSRPWELTDAGLVANNMGGASFLTVPGMIPEEYDLHIRLTIEREQADPGNDVHISLPHAIQSDYRQAFPFVIRRSGMDTQLSFWPEDSDLTALGNPPLGLTLQRENPFAEGGTITFQVRSRNISVLLNDELQFELDHLHSALMSEIPFVKLGSWQNRVVFHSIVLIPYARGPESRTFE